MATRLDTVEPLELPSIRDEARERHPWSAVSTATVALSIAAAVLVVLAFALADDATAERVVAGVLVGRVGRSRRSSWRVNGHSNPSPR